MQPKLLYFALALGILAFAFVVFIFAFVFLNDSTPGTILKMLIATILWSAFMFAVYKRLKNHSKS